MPVHLGQQYCWRRLSERPRHYAYPATGNPSPAPAELQLINRRHHRRVPRLRSICEPAYATICKFEFYHSQFAIWTRGRRDGCRGVKLRSFRGTVDHPLALLVSHEFWVLVVGFFDVIVCARCVPINIYLGFSLMRGEGGLVSRCGAWLAMTSWLQALDRSHSCFWPCLTTMPLRYC